MKFMDWVYSTHITSRLDQIYEQGRRIMAKVDELLVALEEANTTTNEIADDITSLLTQLTTGGLTPAETDVVVAKINELNTRLKGVAAQYTSPVK